MGRSFLVIAGSVRGHRRSPVIASWVASLAADISSEPFEVVDLRGLGLTLDDEPALPAKGAPYAAAATQRWSERVAAAAGVVMVTPQYNWGYPAALKNAIDHLYREWKGKPVLIVTYGGRGGGKCAAQLREVMEGLDACQTPTSPGLRLARKRIETDDGAVIPDHDFATQRDEVVTALRELVALETPA